MIGYFFCNFVAFLEDYGKHSQHRDFDRSVLGGIEQ